MSCALHSHSFQYVTPDITQTSEVVCCRNYIAYNIEMHCHVNEKSYYFIKSRYAKEIEIVFNDNDFVTSAYESLFIGI